MIELDVISFSLILVIIVGLFYVMLRKIIALHREVSNLNMEISDHERQLVEAAKKAREEIRSEVATLVVAGAEKILGSEIDQEKNAEIIEEISKEF